MLFSVDVLFLSKTLEQIDDDFLNLGQVLIERGGRRLFSEGCFQTIPEVIWDVGEFTMGRRNNRSVRPERQKNAFWVDREYHLHEETKEEYGTYADE